MQQGAASSIDVTAGWSAAPDVALVNLGCRVNRVESDWIEADLRRLGCRLCSPDDARAIVVNSCAVTGEAQAKTRKAVRHALGLRREPLVYVTGCAANLFPDELLGLGERVRLVTKKEDVAQTLVDELAGDVGDGRQRLPHEGGQVDAVGGRAKRGVKVQDGCDNACSFCIVWRARGASRSFEPSQVLAQVSRVLDEGAREVELTGINLGKYRCFGSDGAALGLGWLIDQVAARCRGRAQVRASSLEPPELTPDVVDAFARNADVVCPHLHLPLQAGCDRTLARMGRHYTTAEFAQAVARAREALPTLALSTDIIVAFPGETDDEFEQSLAFYQDMAFAKIHAFRYSMRPGTPAAAMDDQVPPAVSAARAARLQLVAQSSAADDRRRRVGTRERVLVEEVDINGVGRGTTESFHRARVEGWGRERHAGELVTLTLKGLDTITGEFLTDVREP